MSDEKIKEELKEANEAFYRAFETLNIKSMEGIWLKSDEIRCILPAGKLIKGRTAVMESWQRIFENATFIQFIITDVQISAFDDIGIVNCVENIVDIASTDSTTYSALLATNIFKLEENGWFMIMHHTSHFLPV